MAVNKKAELVYQLRKCLLSLGRSLTAAQHAQDHEAQKDIKKTIDCLKKRLQIILVGNDKEQRKK